MILEFIGKILNWFIFCVETILDWVKKVVVWVFKKIKQFLVWVLAKCGIDICKCSK